MADDIDQSQQKNDSDGNTLHGNLPDSMATLLSEMKIVFNKLFILWDWNVRRLRAAFFPMPGAPARQETL